ncbi:MAG: hypothetical protein GY792_33015 [Gammaproteobacteria bacterium]|nr:hypothetical protein [Gammaproteobacteria bacterium]
MIPEIVDKEQKPFWIYYWKDNEIWRIDDRGQNRELLLDTHKSLGQWLTAHPMEGTDCCWTGPRVVVSPNGQKLALVVVDKEQLTQKGRSFTFSIYVFDVQSHDLKLISEGTLPVWSPNEKRIAFIKDGSLWIADLESGQIHERVIKHEKQSMSITELAWSPDSKQIAYLYNFGMHRIPAIWLVDADDGTPPRQLLSLRPEWEIYRIEWLPGRQQIFFLSQEGSRDISQYHRVDNLWSVSLATGERTQLTQDMQVQSYGILPDSQWLFIAGYHLYERSQGNYDHDLWLLSLDGRDLRRITTDQGDLGVAGWNPGGTHWIVRHAGVDISLFSLGSGMMTALNFELGFNFAVGGAK